MNHAILVSPFQINTYNAAGGRRTELDQPQKRENNDAFNIVEVVMSVDCATIVLQSSCSFHWRDRVNSNYLSD